MVQLGVRSSAQDLREQAAVLAVEALDAMVSDLIADRRLAMPRHFLDWVVDVATIKVANHATRLARCMEGEASHGVALQSTVREWVHAWATPRLHAQLGESMPARYAIDFELP